jgi:hypothetical protein
MSIPIAAIDNLFKEKNFDIRVKNGSRYMDQKVTPDVLAFIADCVLNLSATKAEFDKDDIWHSDYFNKNVKAVFNKPDAENEGAIHEYDKFSAQPLKALAFAGVLDEKQVSRKNVYTINDMDVLKFIAQSDRNAMEFLYYYIKKVLTDSGFIEKLEEYAQLYRRDSLTAYEFKGLKEDFEKFTRGNTKINTDTEIHRIFPKVINIYCYKNGLPGSRRGFMTSQPYFYRDLMYNDVNFRDLNKEKAATRQEASSFKKTKEQQESYTDYQMDKAKGAVRTRHYPTSEVKDALVKGLATQVHHIFSKEKFPDFRATTENLILLTPSQHNSLAHPNNNTRVIDPEYQIVCLKAKLVSIEASYARGDSFYDKGRFIDMLNVGLGAKLAYDATFVDIKTRLNGLLSHHL